VILRGSRIWDRTTRRGGSSDVYGSGSGRFIGQFCVHLPYSRNVGSYVVVITSEMELLDAAVVITTSKLVDVVYLVVMADELCTDPGRAAH
jgi:hypothetical protein